MKEDVKTALESSMGLAVLEQAKQIQKLYRGFKARTLFRKMKKSDRLIKLHLRKYLLRRKFRKVVNRFLERLRIRIYKLQKAFKRLLTHKKIFIEVNKRV